MFSFSHATPLHCGDVGMWGSILGMSLEEKEGEEEWDHGVNEEDGEFAYDGYVNVANKDRRRQPGTSLEVAPDHTAPPDGFLGKHCPICLRGISHSSSAIDSCKHIYCTSCLSEVGQCACRLLVNA